MSRENEVLRTMHMTLRLKNAISSGTKASDDITAVYRATCKNEQWMMTT